MAAIASSNAVNLSANTASTKVKQVPAIPAKHRRALLVGDSKDILIVASAFLGAFKFDVVCAASAEEALSVLADGAPVDLLVTDYALPGMNGKDLVVRARERHRKLRALIISGYADSFDLIYFPDGVTLLARPFRRAEFYNCILSVMEPTGHLQDKRQPVSWPEGFAYPRRRVCRRGVRMRWLSDRPCA
jgi:CheY-like chemotaxis protein